MSLKSSTNTATNTYELIIEIDPTAFDLAVEKVFKKQKNKISIPGFRKGKVTRKLAENYFGEGAFYEEAVQELAGTQVALAVEEAKLEIVDRPELDVVSLDKENGLVLKAICTTKPEIDIKNYKGIKAAKVIEEITDKSIDEQIDVMRKRNARIISIDDRAAQLDDEVTIDFEGLYEGSPFEGGKAEDFALKLGSGQFIPGFEDAVIGHNAGEQFEINVSFPEDYHVAELAGKPVVFKINLKEIKVQELPELDDEFVKDTSEFDTVDELKADIKTKLVEGAENKATSEFENDIFQTIIDNIEGEIPECMYESRVDSLINEFEARLKTQGMKLDLYLQYTGMDIESLRASYIQRATEEVKLRLALEKISILENLSVSDEEVENGIAEIATQNKVDVNTVKMIINPNDYRTDLLVSKAADLVKENAIVDNDIVKEEVKTEE